MRQSTAAVLLGVLSALVPLAAAETLCNATVKCPESAPCCSPYGYCNTADSPVCLGGCQPWYSFTETSCKPAPACRDITTNFNDLSGVVNGTDYKGNSTAADWTLDAGKLVADPDGNGARLILTQDGEAGKGTKISSTHYVHYGQIDFEMQISKWAGVVSAAITMSDVKDEIDWEWVSDHNTEAQSNVFSLGSVTYTDGQTFKDLTDTSSNFHIYSINWQEEYLQWLIDGKVQRTLYKNATLASDGSGRYNYPSTPSRVQISIWAAGTDSFAQGTVDWAGGMIDWSNADYAANGYFYNTLKSVSIKCADSDAALDSGLNVVTGYQYAGNDSSEAPVVQFTNRSTVLGSGAMVGIAGVSMFGVAAIAGVVAAFPSLVLLF